MSLKRPLCEVNGWLFRYRNPAQLFRICRVAGIELVEPVGADDEQLAGAERDDVVGIETLRVALLLEIERIGFIKNL